MLETVATEIRTCTACGLHETRTQAVPGSGAGDAQIVFVGEAPGAQEDKRGLPFVGQAGKLLDQLLESIGLDRSQVYIANVIKCRPPDNRPPRKGEIAACRHFLDRQLAVIQPRLIVTLGRFSLAQFCPEAGITQVHGQVQRVGGRLIYPLYQVKETYRNLLEVSLYTQELSLKRTIPWSSRLAPRFFEPKVRRGISGLALAYHEVLPAWAVSPATRQ